MAKEKRKKKLKNWTNNEIIDLITKHQWEWKMKETEENAWKRVNDEMRKNTMKIENDRKRYR